METAFDTEQQQISDLMLDSWVSLASTGDPNPGGGATNMSVVWNPGQTMVLLCCKTRQSNALLQVFGLRGEVTSAAEWRDRMMLWDRLYWQTKREVLQELVSQVEANSQDTAVQYGSGSQDYADYEEELPQYQRPRQ